MTRKLLSKTLLFVATLIFCSCGEGSLFFPTADQSSEITVQTLESGAIVQPGEPVNLKITYPKQESGAQLELEVRFVTSTGETVWKKKIPSPALNEEFPLENLKLPKGQYEMEITLTTDGTVKFRKTTTVFLAEGRYLITGIKSYPPLIRTSATVQLKAQLKIPEGSDPFIRWSIKEKAIARGLLSKGFGEIIWTAPAEEGVYPVTVELFPSEPFGETDFSFISSVTMTADLFVSKGKEGQKNDLFPESSYASLFSFEGNLKDSGVKAPKTTKLEPVSIGKPELVPTDQGFGYKLNGSSGFSIPWIILPIETESLKPFTLSIGLALETIAGGNRILNVSAANGSFRFAIYLNEEASPEASLTIGEAKDLTFSSGITQLEKEKRYLLSFSAIPQEDRLTGMWFLDRIQTSSQTSVGKLPAFKSEGKTIIAGEKGFAGIIDELGVYFKDEQGRFTSDPRMYRLAMEAQHGKSLLLAEGFDAIFLAEGITVSGTTKIEAGLLNLNPDSKLELPPVSVGKSGCDLEIAFVNPTQGSDEGIGAISGVVDFLWFGTEKPFLEIDSTGTAMVSGAKEGIPILFPKDDSTLSLSFVSQKAITFETKKGISEAEIPPGPDSGSTLCIRILNPKTSKVQLSIDRLSIIERNATQ